MSSSTAANGTSFPPNHTGTLRMVASNGTATLPGVPVSFQNSAPWTIELWFSLDALVDQMPLIGKTGEFSLSTRGAVLQAAFAGQTVPLRSTPLLTTGQPYCACVTYDGLNMSLYLDGGLAAQATTSASPPATGNALVIGGGFYGEIQGVRLWSQAMNAFLLAQNQFTPFAPGTPLLLAQIDFTAQPPADSSGNGVVPVLSPKAVYVPLVPAGSFGNTAFCDPYNDGAVNPGGSPADFSLNAWICPSVGSLMYVFANGVEESNSGTTLAVDAAGHMLFQVGDSAVLTSSATLQNGVWANVAATWSGDTGTLYINGAQDSTQGEMTLAGSLPEGEPLVGAIASVGAKLPINSFVGLIQSVCVWNVALTAAQVQQYLSDSPQGDPSCVAYYDLSQAPAQNQVSLNPLGLVAGTTLVPAPVGGSPFAAATVREALRGAGAAAAASAAPVDAEAEFARLLDAYELTAEQRAFFAGHHSASLARGEEEHRAGTSPGLGQIRIDPRPGGGTRVVRVSAQGEELILDTDLDPCTTWRLTLLANIVGALWLALGVKLNFAKFLNGMTTFLGTRINAIGVMPQLVALFANGVSGRAIYNSLWLLHEYSLLTPLAKLSYQVFTTSVGWWTILSLGMRIALLMSPSAPVELLWFVAQLAYSAYTIQQCIQQAPAGCLGAVGQGRGPQPALA